MKCELCPRRCGVDRSSERGFCGMGENITAAKAMLHHWEEPCISGKNGAGAVFFSGCVLKCAYCQNYGISTENYGMEITARRLSDIFLELYDSGAECIDLVNPTHFAPQIAESIAAVKQRLDIPIVYNSGGYERVETLKMFDGLVDVYLPDIKYFDNGLAQRLSAAPNYFETAMDAVDEMLRQTGAPLFGSERSGCSPQLLRGTLVRHLILPGMYKDSLEVVKRIAVRYGSNILFSLMSQYTPMGRVKSDPALSKMNRRITTFEYQKVLNAVLDAGLQGYMQERSSANEEYTPIFDLSGL